MKDYILKQIKDSYDTKLLIYNDAELVQLIQDVSQIIVDAYKKGNKVLIAGNGGSAADAQHLAGEFVSRFYFDRPGLPGLALSTDTSVMTAIGNDYGFERIFARQIEANGVAGDVFIGISTSGNSANIIEALKTCKSQGVISVGFVGESGGKMAEHCDYCIKVPSNITPRIQEAHIMVGHIICAIVEEAVFGKGF
ncbi:D-sedoheptulose 7-phosphate isomerase [bacterium]|nr:D-sedoheptulose 7-phosphate isomerase [bacterium]